MIQQGQVQEFAGFSQTAGQVDVCLAGLQAAGGVVVQGDDGSGARVERRFKQHFYVYHRTGHTAGAEALAAGNFVGFVEQEQPEFFVVQVGQQRRQRPEGVEAGTAKLVGTDRDRIAAEAERLLTDPAAYAAMAVGLSLMPHIPATRTLGVATLVGIGVMGVVCVWGVRSAYRDALRRAIDERTFDFDAVPTARLDDEMRRVLGAELSGPDSRRAGLAAELLCEGDTAPTPDVLTTALASKFEHVRVAALDAVAKHRLAAFAEACAKALEEDEDWVTTALLA